MVTRPTLTAIPLKETRLKRRNRNQISWPKILESLGRNVHKLFHEKLFRTAISEAINLLNEIGQWNAEARSHRMVMSTTRPEHPTRQNCRYRFMSCVVNSSHWARLAGGWHASATRAGRGSQERAGHLCQDSILKNPATA